MYDCPIPAGLEAEQHRRLDALINERQVVREGDWYERVPAPLTVKYVVPSPLSLDLARTPILVGTLRGGPGYGDRVDRPLVCGHYLELHNWTVLIERIDGGFASFDIRDALASEPVPSEALSHPLAQYSFGFELGGVTYQYVLTSVAVALVRVYRPDLEDVTVYLDGIDPGDKVTKRRELRGEDHLWPVASSVSGLLFASTLPDNGERLQNYGERNGRDPATLSPLLVGRSLLSFSSDLRDQPVDLTGAPHYIGQVLGGQSARHPDAEYHNGFALSLRDEMILVSRENGASVEIDIGEWFDRQIGLAADGDVLINDPVVSFTMEGIDYQLVVNILRAVADLGPDGQYAYRGDFIMADLFASTPPK